MSTIILCGIAVYAVMIFIGITASIIEAIKNWINRK
jgi:hypothetical protein